jgi:hypothetical protein
MLQNNIILVFLYLDITASVVDTIIREGKSVVIFTTVAERAPLRE